ncbi:class I SAM-dependent methyltransferase [candidate division KSB1 bacterium]
MTKEEKTKFKAINLFFKHREHLKQKEINHYKGEGVICPICESAFRSFAPYYGHYLQKNARCPKCESLERHRLLWEYLHNKTELFNKSKKKLLHFAPEKFFFEFFSNQKMLEYTPCDISPEKYEEHYGGKLVKADITNLPFPDSEFDVIICYHILEHIPNDQLAIAELYRVMKVGGWGIIQVPIDYNRESTYEDFNITSEEEREKAFGQKDHVRWYGKDFIVRLSLAGFTVIEDKFVNTFSTEEIAKFGFDPNEIIYYCEKQ